MKKILAVAVPKGGVGKTTTAVNLAASLAVLEKKTLLIDFDPSGSCSTYLGFDEETIKRIGSIFDVFTFAKSIPQVIHRTEIENLDFIPSKVDDLEMEERISRISNHTTIFANILNKPELENYEYVILDCPPYLKGLTTVAVSTSNSVIIPVKAGQFSVSALSKMVKYINKIKENYHRKLTIEGILFTMYEVNTKAWKKTEEEVNAKFGDLLFKTIIPKNIALTESEFYGKPVVLYKAKSTGARAYLELAKEIILKDVKNETSIIV